MKTSVIEVHDMLSVWSVDEVEMETGPIKPAPMKTDYISETLTSSLRAALATKLLSPIIAGAAMSLSSVSVISNALRLRNVKL